MFFVYALQSLSDKKVYVGSTALSPNQRLEEHNQGKVKWTRAHRHFKLVFFELFSTRELALQREKFFKTGKGRQVLRSKIKDFSDH